MIATLAGSGGAACCAYVGGSLGDGSNSLKSVIVTGTTSAGLGTTGDVNVLGFGDMIYFTDS